MKHAADAVLKKITKYEPYLKGWLPRLASVLDPRIAISHEERQSMKPQIEQILIHQYDWVAVPYCPDEECEEGDIFTQAARDSGLNVSDVSNNEVDDFFEFARRADTSCKDVVGWWGSIGCRRFPFLSLLARDTLMIMGSSVPSESAFSYSGDFVTRDRASLSDDSICTMMKLRSWTRLLKEINS